MNIIAYILFVMQALSIYGGVSEYGGRYLGALLSSGIPYLLGYFLPTILGFFFLSRHKKSKAKKHAAFYCNTCRDVVGSPSGKKCTCLNCRQMRRELPVRMTVWETLSKEEKDELIAK